MEMLSLFRNHIVQNDPIVHLTGPRFADAISASEVTTVWR